MILVKSLSLSRTKNPKLGLRKEAGTKQSLWYIWVLMFKIRGHRPFLLTTCQSSSLRENVFQGAFAGKTRERKGKEKKADTEEKKGSRTLLSIQMDV